MGVHVRDEIVWSASDGSAKALTTSYAATSQSDAWHEVLRGVEVTLLLEGSGTDPTSYDVVIEVSFDGGTKGYLVAAVNSVSGGAVDFDPAVLTFPGSAHRSCVTPSPSAEPGKVSTAGSKSTAPPETEFTAATR